LSVSVISHSRLLSPSTNRLALYTGHGLIGTTHAEDIESLVNRVIEQGLPPYLLRELDLVVFPRHVDGERYVGQAVELLSEGEFQDLDRETGCGSVHKNGTAVYWNTVTERTEADEFRFAYDHPDLGDETRAVRLRTLHRVAALTDRPVTAVEEEFRRKHRYVEYFVRQEIDDFEGLFDLLADLRTEEAATVERLRRRDNE
jgi:hypothetical protein